MPDEAEQVAEGASSCDPTDSASIGTIPPTHHQCPKHLVLVGLSYSGKTTVGARAAARLGLPFVDTDAEIERRAGLSVPLIFQQQGEEAFRALERQTIAEVLERPPSVIATGGGAPMDSQNRRLLWTGNLVVFLETSLPVLLARMLASVHQAERPLLSGSDPQARLRLLAEQRRPVYRQAHRAIITDGRTVEEVAEAVCAVFRAASTACRAAGAGATSLLSAPPASARQEAVVRQPPARAARRRGQDEQV